MHIKVLHLPGKGRGVLAARQLPAGTVVMRAYPYVLRGGATDTFSDVILKMVRRRMLDQNTYFDSVIMSMSDNESPDHETVDEGLITAAQAIDPTVTELTVRRLASVFWHNCFPEGVCPELALFNHSCDPNCAYRVDWDDNCAFVMRTNRAVNKGEELCINYLCTTDGPLAVRQELLHKGWQFWCKCDLCLQEQKPGPKGKHADRRTSQQPALQVRISYPPAREPERPLCLEGLRLEPKGRAKAHGTPKRSAPQVRLSYMHGGQPARTMCRPPTV